MEKLNSCPDKNNSTTVTQEEVFPTEWKQRILEEKIVHSPYRAVDVPDVSFPEFIFQHLDQNGEKIFLIDGSDDRQFSYKTTSALTKRVASGLIRLGLQPGEIVTFFSYNSPEYAISFLAAVSVGAIVAGVSPSYVLGELLHELKDTEPTMLIVDSLHTSLALEAAKQVPSIRKMIVFGEAINGFFPFSQLLEDDGTLFKGPVAVKPKDDVMYINYSSGTTGLPKGVMHTHFTTIAVLSQMTHPQVHCSAVKTTIPALLPFSHTTGALVLWFAAITAGAVITFSHFLSEQFLSAIDKYKISSLPISPAAGIILLKSSMTGKYDWSSVNQIVSGGSNLPEKLESLLMKKFGIPIRQVYGLTESYKITTTPMNFPRRQSIGVPMPTTALKVVNTETKELCGPGESGEICFSAPYIMKGYWKNPEATAALIDQDGWLHTGDIGYYDKDGYFFLVNRIKDLIKCRSYQISPAELEELLLSHPFVEDAAVIGVPDDFSGEVPRAFVVIQTPNAVSEQEIKDFVAERISEVKHLKGGVIFVEKIARSPAGKILRKELAKMHL